MPQKAQAPGASRQPNTNRPTVEEAARFLRNLTSLPDPDFRDTYAPAITAAFSAYDGLPNASDRQHALLHALKHALKRRRAFIVPRFTDAEDSWRIRECVSYALAVAVLVDHADAILHVQGTDQQSTAGVWAAILSDPAAHRHVPATRAALLHNLVPDRGRRWIASEPLVRDLLAGYFAGTEPNELREIAGPVVEGFRRDNVQPADVTPHDPSPDLAASTAPSNRQLPKAGWISRLRQLLARPWSSHGRVPAPEPPAPCNDAVHRDALDTASRVAARLGLDNTVRGDLAPLLEPLAGYLASHGASLADLHLSVTPEPDAASARRPADQSASSSTTSSPARNGPQTMADSPPTEEPPSGSNSESSDPPAHRSDTPPSSNSAKSKRRSRNRPRRADVLDGLPAAVHALDSDATLGARSRSHRPAAIGDHAATTARIGHGADYARTLTVVNGSLARPNPEAAPLPGPIATPPGALALDIDALFPQRSNPAHLSPDAIAPWTAFRSYLADALQSGTLTANDSHSLVHLLDTGVFLLWPGVALAYADEHRVSPTAIKAAMRTARVLAVNRADRQEDKHGFPALTGDQRVTCHGLVTLPEYLWPDVALRPREPSRFVRPPAIYGQRYRRKH